MAFKASLIWDLPPNDSAVQPPPLHTAGCSSSGSITVLQVFPALSHTPPTPPTPPPPCPGLRSCCSCHLEGFPQRLYLWNCPLAALKIFCSPLAFDSLTIQLLFFFPFKPIYPACAALSILICGLVSFITFGKSLTITLQIFLLPHSFLSPAEVPSANTLNFDVVPRFLDPLLWVCFFLLFSLCVSVWVISTALSSSSLIFPWLCRISRRALGRLRAAAQSGRDRG